jgi:hypothetical protein
MVVVFQNINFIEIVQHVFIKAKGELDGYGTDQDGHFSTFFHFDIMEAPGFSE